MPREIHQIASTPPAQEPVTHPKRPVRLMHHDAAERPFIVIWEVTRACQLACTHCRAEAIRTRNPFELTTDEGRQLLDDLASFGTPRPLVVLTGGDPFERPDLPELVAHGTRIGLSIALSPSVTARLTRTVLVELHEAGAKAVSLSLDGATAQTHDDFRGVDGVFAATVDAARTVLDVGFRLQINTTVSRANVRELPRILRTVVDMGASLWSVFFLVPMGRGQELSMISPEQHERVLTWLYELSLAGDFDVKATAAPMYRRIAMQRRVESRTRHAGDVAGAGFSFHDGLNRPVQGVNDGRGFLFVSHLGEITPSGFLPIVTGNVRTDDVVDVYRNHPLFRSLRDPSALTGKCGACEFRDVCGGQRGRAYAVTGDPLASDPACAYVPAALR